MLKRCSCRNFKPVLIFVNIFQAACRFAAVYLTRYHHKVYHLEHKHLFSVKKTYVWTKVLRKFVFKMVYVEFVFGGKKFKGVPC